MPTATWPGNVMKEKNYNVHAKLVFATIRIIHSIKHVIQVSKKTDFRFSIHAYTVQKMITSNAKTYLLLITSIKFYLFEIFLGITR